MPSRTLVIGAVIAAVLIIAGLYQVAEDCGADFNGFAALFTSTCRR